MYRALRSLMGLSQVLSEHAFPGSNWQPDCYLSSELVDLSLAHRSDKAANLQRPAEGDRNTIHSKYQ